MNNEHNEICKCSVDIRYYLNFKYRYVVHSCLLPLRRVHEIKRMYLAPRTHGLFIT